MPIAQPFPFPALIADVGGTNARFAVVGEAGSAIKSLGSVRTGDFADFAAAARHVLAAAGAAAPRSLLVDGAGPVVGNEIKLTNADWRLVIDDIGRDMRVGVAMLLNDFEALSLSLPFLPESGVRRIGERAAGGPGAKIVVGPGTGLGATTLVEVGGRFVPVPSEAGMSDIGPVTAVEETLWPHLERHAGRVYAEWLLSGGGLVRLHQAVRRRDGAAAGPLTAAAIGEAAVGGDPAARQAVDIFLGLLARYSGDLALIVKATGGVFSAGGVVQRLASLIDAPEFRRRFEAKSPLDDLMRDIATHLITLDVPAFIGLKEFAATPARFHLEAAERLWHG